MSNQSQNNITSGMSGSEPLTAEMAKQQIQAVYNKLDKAQYYLDQAADIISDLRTDNDVAIVEIAHPWTRLEQKIELTEQRIDNLSDKTMNEMLTDLKQCGAQRVVVAPVTASPSVIPGRMTKSVEADDPALRFETELFRNAVSATPLKVAKGPDGYTSTIPFTSGLANARPSASPVTTPSSANVGRRIPTLAQNYMHRPSTPSNISLGSKGTPIPMFKEDLDEKDKMMMEWRAKGKSWAEVKDEWEKMNGGHRIGNSTLPNRFVRIKAAFGEFDAQYARGG